MKRLFLLVTLVITILFSQTVLDAPGPHVLWNGDTLRKDSSWVSDVLHTGHFAYLGVWLKTTNPKDSTKYRLYYKGAFSKTDTFAIPSDTLGSENGSTIMRVTDTLWHYCSVQVACAPYTKLYIDADATDHGNRACVWVKVFLWRPGYWEDYKILNE